MYSKFMPIVTLAVLASLVFGQVASAAPNPPVVEHTYYVPTGRLCMTGDESHTLSDDVYGTFTGQGLYNEYIVTITGDGGHDYFRVSIDLLGYHKGDKIIIRIKEYDLRTVSFYYHVDTPIYRIPSGTYTVQIGYLKVGSVPAAYRVNMG